MRIVGGKYKGRKIEPPKNNKIRPTSDSVRESLFNILAHSNFGQYKPKKLEGCSFLDLFCGTGAVGIESLSRGAAKVVLVDEAAESIALAKKNANHILDEEDLDKISFIKNKNSRIADNQHSFDFIFLDPPYAKGLVPASLRHLITSGYINSGSLVIIESDKGETIDQNITGKKFKQIFSRDYGRTKITILAFESNEQA